MRALLNPGGTHQPSSLRPGARPRVVVAEGNFTGQELPETGVPIAGFRFGILPLRQSWFVRTRAGVTHQSAATLVHAA